MNRCSVLFFSIIFFIPPSLHPMKMWMADKGQHQKELQVHALRVATDEITNEKTYVGTYPLKMAKELLTIQLQRGQQEQLEKEQLKKAENIIHFNLARHTLQHIGVSAKLGKVVTVLRDTGKDGWKPWDITITTNGTLINNLLLTLSIPGDYTVMLPRDVSAKIITAERCLEYEGEEPWYVFQEPSSK